MALEHFQLVKGTAEKNGTALEKDLFAGIAAAASDAEV